jgi:5'-phosphate synthase pdxT subunit
VGVLALQGDFEAHRKALERAGVGAREVRRAAELEGLDGLILPGGESTTMLKLLRDEALLEPLAEFGQRRPIFGTCAGAILLAREVSHPPQASLGLMEISVERNAYGRQLDSHVARLEPEEAFARAAGPGEVEAVFIRAPRILRAGPGVQVLLRHRGDPVLVAEGRHLAATFHPELSGDTRIHRLFLDML